MNICSGVTMAHAVDVAGYIVKSCIDSGYTITNMKLQKMLYFAWIDYFKENNKSLFDDEFLAWKYGPVIYDVYQKYRIFGAMPISYAVDTRLENIDKSVKQFLNNFIEKNGQTSGGMLMIKSHREGGAWSKIHKKGSSNIIPFDLIKELESS